MIRNLRIYALILISARTLEKMWIEIKIKRLNFFKINFENYTILKIISHNIIAFAI